MFAHVSFFRTTCFFVVENAGRWHFKRAFPVFDDIWKTVQVDFFKTDHHLPVKDYVTAKWIMTYRKCSCEITGAHYRVLTKLLQSHMLAFVLIMMTMYLFTNVSHIDKTYKSSLCNVADNNLWKNSYYAVVIDRSHRIRSTEIRRNQMT